MNDNMLSVSKGVFVFKNGGTSHHKRCRKPLSSINGSTNIFAHNLWYQSYSKMWTTVEKKLEILSNDMFTNLLSSLVLSIEASYSQPVAEVPTIILLTGINMPDHSVQFSTLFKEVRKIITPHVAILHAEDCQSLKHVVENTINQFVNEEEFETSDKKLKVRKPQCTFALLQAWYEKLYGLPEERNFSSVKRGKRDGHKVLTVIVPDFESFNDKVMQDFILVLSSYLNILPFVLVFGVATSLNAVHKSLPYHVSSKISVQIFNSQPSIVYLNNVIEHVFFTDYCSFHLGGKVFNLFTDIFLFYDLSVKGFIKNVQFAMLDHFSYGNIMALCTSSRNLRKIADQLGHEDFEKIRSLASVQKLLEKQSSSLKSKFLDDEKFKIMLVEEIQLFHEYLSSFHLFLKCLHVLVYDLPNTPLGKQIRELYCFAVSKNVTRSAEYSECFKLLGFQSKEELSDKVLNICKILEEDIENNKIKEELVEKVLKTIRGHLEKIEATTNTTEEVDDCDQDTVESPQTVLSGKMNRKMLKEKLLLEVSRNRKPMNKYEKTRTALIEYLRKMFENFLQEPSSKPFYEIFFFNDFSIKKQIMGSHRAGIHTALSDPQHYLQCDCCELQNDDTILASMPDISILYKLHLEYGKLINLYDWLQSFLSIVDPNDKGEEGKGGKIVVKPELQARFTQAVADLEFLGFIKNSKRKADHVIRLTWGG